MNTWWSARIVPVTLLAALVAGCNNGDKDSDDPTDDTPPVDTFPGETGADMFTPTSLSYLAVFAIGEDGLPRSFTQQNTEVDPFFSLVLSDGRDECEFRLFLKPEAFAYVGMPDDDTDVPDTDEEDTDVPDTDVPDTDVPDTDDTDPPDTDIPAMAAAPADLVTFLDESDLLFGFKIAPGLFDLAYTAVCEDLGSDLEAIALQYLRLNSTDPNAALFLGFNTAISSSLWTEIGQQAGVERSKLLGGKLQFPFQFQGPTGNVNYFDVTGVIAEIDENWAPVVNGQNLVLQDSDTAWQGDKPGRGYYQLYSPYGWNFSGN